MSDLSHSDSTALDPCEQRVRALAAVLAMEKHVDTTMLEAFVGVYLPRIDAAAGEVAPFPDLGDAGADVPDAAIGARAMVAIPRDADGPSFRAPWEALTFVLATLLQQRGTFTWPEWAGALGAELRRVAAGEGGTDRAGGYFAPWIAALEQLVTTIGITDEAALAKAQAEIARR